MSGFKGLLIDLIRLTDEVKRLDSETVTLAHRTTDIDKRVVRLETIIEIKGAPAQTPSK